MSYILKLILVVLSVIWKFIAWFKFCPLGICENSSAKQPLSTIIFLCSDSLVTTTLVKMAPFPTSLQLKRVHTPTIFNFEWREYISLTLPWLQLGFMVKPKLNTIIESCNYRVILISECVIICHIIYWQSYLCYNN